MKYSICVEMLFKEVEFLRRLEHVRKTGFDYFEFWTWQDKDLPALQKAARDNNLKVASFSGDDQYSMINGEEAEAYLAFLNKSLEMAKTLGCEHLVIHSDSLLPGGQAKRLKQNLSVEEKLFNMYRILKKAATLAEKKKVKLVLEPLNSLVDHPNYFLDHPELAFLLVKMVDSENVKVLYDIYHMQIMRGNIIATLQENIEYIGYIHVADVPGRHEPATGELNYHQIFRSLANLNYQGIIGFELEPQTDSEQAIAHIKAVLI